MTSRDHARRLMLILLANDRSGLRLAQDGPTAHRVPRREHEGSAQRAGHPAHAGAATRGTLAHVA